MATAFMNTKSNCPSFTPRGVNASAKKQIISILDGPKLTRSFRYRRSTVTKAPRKRTFIANMQKYLIDQRDQAGPAWSAAGSISNCSTAIAYYIGAPVVDAMLLPSTLEEVSLLAMDGGSGNGSSGKTRYARGGDDDSDDVDEQLLRFLPPYLLAAVLAVAASLLPVVAPSSSLRPGSSAVDPMVACMAISAGFVLSLVHYSICFVA